MPTQLPRKVRYPHNRLCVCRDCESVRILENNGLIVAVDPSEPVPQQVPDEMGLLVSRTADEHKQQAQLDENRRKAAANQTALNSGKAPLPADDLEANRARAKAKFESLGRPQSGR